MRTYCITATVKILADTRMLVGNKEQLSQMHYAYTCRCAYDLGTLIPRQPGPEPKQGHHIRDTITTRSATDLEYLDVFDFFSLPRPTLRSEQDISPGNQNSNQDSNQDTNQVPFSEVIGGNEVSITDYLIPTPESDCLVGRDTFWT